MKTMIIVTAAMTLALAAPSLAQVAPAPAPPIAAAPPKAGWVAQAVSFTNGKFGDVPLASAIVGAAQNDAFAVLSRRTSSPFAGLLLRGEINAPETGKYGLLLDIQAGGQTGFCNYSLSVDGKKMMTYQWPAPQPATADKSVEMTAGRHPIAIDVGCSRPNVSKVLVGLKVKLPSADALVAPGTEFIVHPAGASGD